MDRPRWLSVSINEKGIEEYDYGVEDTENIRTFLLDYSEFEVLYNVGGIFDKINDSCNLLIDDYESEIITKEHFNKCKELIQDQNVPIFAEALNLAIKYDTLLGLDF